MNHDTMAKEGTLVTKRLHISGLTPSITSTDVHRRLSTFGSVKSLDGFGKLDALGDPRPFAYATLEGKEKDLARCMNVLSGSTWKGTKLRIGEAKPDYRQRIDYLNSRPPPPPRTTRSKRLQLVVVSPVLDTPLSRDDAVKMPGSAMPPSGRVIRHMRTRPERPLEPTHATGGVQRTRGQSGEKGKKGRKTKDPPLRARRRMIDPTKWESTYLTGALLEMVVDAGTFAEDETEEAPQHAFTREVEERTGGVGRVSINPAQRNTGEDVQMGDTHPTTAHLPATANTRTATPETDTTAAAVPTKTKLKDLFAPREEELSFSLLSHLDLDLELEDDVLGASSISATTLPSTHVTASSSEPSSGLNSKYQVPVKKPGHEGDRGITLDSTRPLLFPLVQSLPYSYPGTPDSNLTSRLMHTHARSETGSIVFPRSHVNAGVPRDPSSQVPLSGTEWRLQRSPDATEQSIREVWERNKGELTNAWKKAWKEARGKRRRGATAGGMDM
ncbi:hypothetical protein EDC04DRAFT_3146498 [Pisolithus marmoratus]|nr:hypothetical protein EDC04DRAFT_3146498 [Pisolithus marmoratus]